MGTVYGAERVVTARFLNGPDGRKRAVMAVAPDGAQVMRLGTPGCERVTFGAGPAGAAVRVLDAAGKTMSALR